MISFLSHKFGRGPLSSPELYCIIGIGVLQGHSSFALAPCPFLFIVVWRENHEVLSFVDESPGLLLPTIGKEQIH